MATVATRVARIAEAVLAEQQFVTPVDVLTGLGWLTPPHVRRWQHGLVAALDVCIAVDSAKTKTALAALDTWAQENGLQAWETDYGDLPFTENRDPATERQFRTRWAAAGHAAPTPPKARDLEVMLAPEAFTCALCEGDDDLLLKAPQGGICLDCADLGHLEFLPAGDAALTRRAKKTSRLSAVVVRWNRRRNRFERQGILVEAEAIELATEQCVNDAEARGVRRERDAVRRVAIDEQFRDRFAAAVREQFPGCPPGRAEKIAYHAALRGSGRVGRSAAGRALDHNAVRLAVTASVRHLDTDYDDLLMAGVERDEARARVAARIGSVLDAWRDGAVPLD